MSKGRHLSGWSSEEDRRVSGEVMTLVLAGESARLNSGELQAQLGGPDEIERAVEVLIDSDLVAREGDEIVPTPAAIRADRLRIRGRLA